MPLYKENSRPSGSLLGLIFDFAVLLLPESFCNNADVLWGGSGAVVQEAAKDKAME